MRGPGQPGPVDVPRDRIGDVVRFGGGVNLTDKIGPRARGPVAGRLGYAAVAAVITGSLLGTFPRPFVPAAADLSLADPSLVDSSSAISLTGSDLGADPVLEPGFAGRSTPAPSPTAAAAVVESSAPLPAAAPPTYKVDLFDARALRGQEPDSNACTAASTLSMLNTIFYSGTDPTLAWKPSTSYRSLESVLAYERGHMTMSATSYGSDPHGWRNALNYFGWGSINAGVYVDAAYPSFETAAKAAVLALAKTRRPVGILADWGSHAEYMTGYKVTGANPETGSSAFTILGVYITDPHEAAHHRDSWVTYEQWEIGYWRLRFAVYAQDDSTRRDKIDGRVGRKEWLGKWVMIKPVK